MLNGWWVHISEGICECINLKHAWVEISYALLMQHEFNLKIYWIHFKNLIPQDPLKTHFQEKDLNSIEADFCKLLEKYSIFKCSTPSLGVSNRFHSDNLHRSDKFKFSHT